MNSVKWFYLFLQLFRNGSAGWDMSYVGSGGGWL